MYPLYIYVNSDGKGKVLKQFKLSRHYNFSAKRRHSPIYAQYTQWCHVIVLSLILIRHPAVEYSNEDQHNCRIRDQSSIPSKVHLNRKKVTENFIASRK